MEFWTRTGWVSDKQLTTSLLKALNLQVDTAAIADDNVAQIGLGPYTNNAGTVLFSSRGATGLYGWCWARASTTDAIDVTGLKSTATIVGTSNVILTGTTGTDGNWTLSAEGSILYVENRTGASQVITFLCLGAA